MSQSQPSHLLSIILSRRDYWLISSSLSDRVCDVDIIPYINYKTDYSAIIIEMKGVDDSVKGPGLWKLNSSLLRDDSNFEEINHLITFWIQQCRVDLSDPRLVWDWVQSRVESITVITLIEKKDQDQCDLKNWRPISL